MVYLYYDKCFLFSCLLDENELSFGEVFADLTSEWGDYERKRISSGIDLRWIFQDNYLEEDWTSNLREYISKKRPSAVGVRWVFGRQLVSSGK